MQEEHGEHAQLKPQRQRGIKLISREKNKKKTECPGLAMQEQLELD